MRIIILLIFTSIIISATSCGKCGCGPPPDTEPPVLAIQFVKDDGTDTMDRMMIVYNYEEVATNPLKGRLKFDYTYAWLDIKGSDLYRKDVSRINFISANASLSDFSLSFDLQPTKTYEPDDIMGYEMINIMLNDSINLEKEKETYTTHIRLNVDYLKKK